MQPAPLMSLEQFLQEAADAYPQEKCEPKKQVLAVGRRVMKEYSKERRIYNSRVDNVDKIARRLAEKFRRNYNFV